jgi:hypothetical protein
MKFKQYKSILGRSILNIPGWRTNRKIVVFESDDWGSIRMPSKQVYEKLLKNGIRVDKLSFNRFDSLASEKDLSGLFELLSSFRDINGNLPVFTANTIVANPDFDKIKESGFKKYYYEPFTETLKRYPEHTKSFELWKQGMTAGVFHPQFHGREHLNVHRWLKALQNEKGLMRVAFENQMYDLSMSEISISENSFMDSLRYNNKEELDFINESIKEGTNLFESLFNYRAKSFIATCYIWDSNIEASLFESGIKYIKGSYFQKIPISGELNSYKLKYNYTGQKNKVSQFHMVRNIYFEPVNWNSHDIIDDCLFWIDLAFRLKKPAIICTHRLNYIGYINGENQGKNLGLLKELLRRLLQNHPQTEFFTSDQLGDLISSNHN